MMQKNNKIRKNILDIQHNKYLQYFNTTIVILFTYFIGLFIALITKSIDYTNKNHVVITMIVSIAFLSVTTIFLLRFKDKMKGIISEIENLD